MRPLRLRVVLLLVVACGVVVAVAANASAMSPPAMVDGGGAAQAPRFRVVVDDLLTPDDLQRLARRGAVGLLVPGVGPVTNRHYALRSLVHGVALRPSLHGAGAGRPLIDVTSSWRVPPGENVIVLSLPTNTQLAPNDRRYAIVVIGHGYHGLLTSPTTRIPGLVAVTDVASTVLGRAPGSLGFVRSRSPLERLELLDGQIHANNRLKMPTLIILACALILVSALRPRIAVPAILASLLSSLLVGATHISDEPLIVATMVAGTVVGGALLARACATESSLLTAIVLVLVVHLVLLVARPDWVALTPLGPTQNSRFWGIGNQLETLLLTPVVVGAALAARRYGLVGLCAFALLALVVVTDNRLGSDGGGAIVFGVALAFIGARTRRIGLHGFVTLLLLAATTVLAIVSANLRFAGPDHLRSAFSHGFAGLVPVVANRVPLAYVPAARQWPLLVPIGTVFVVAFALALRASDRRSRDLVLAAGLAIAISLLVNDSAVYELAGGIAVVASLARFSTAVSPAPRLAFAPAARAASSED
jgi:hypothetical protein